MIETLLFPAFSIFPAAKTWWPSFPSPSKKREDWFVGSRAEERYTERVERAEHSMEKRETESLSVLLSNDCPSPFFVPNPRRESFLRERAAVKKEETVIKMCL